MFGKFRDAIVQSLEVFFNQPEIKTAKTFEEFSKVAPSVLERMEKSEIPA